MKLLLICFVVCSSTIGWCQNTKCDSGQKPFKDIEPIVKKAICWEDFEMPDQDQLLKELLPKVERGKIPGLYVAFSMSDSNTYYTEPELEFSPAKYDTTQEGVYEYPGQLHVLDYNADGKPDIIAENRRVDRVGVIQFWENTGDSLSLELSVSGYLAAMSKTSNGRPNYFWVHRIYCCEYSIIHLPLYKNVLRNGKYHFELVEKWIYHMNSDLLIPSEFNQQTPFTLKEEAALYARRSELRKAPYIENVWDYRTTGNFKDVTFIPVAKVVMAARGMILHAEIIDGKEWCFVIFEKNTTLSESSFAKHYLTSSPKNDLPKNRYLGYIEGSKLKADYHK